MTSYIVTVVLLAQDTNRTDTHRQYGSIGNMNLGFLGTKAF